MNRQTHPLRTIGLLILVSFVSTPALERQHCTGLDSFRITECGPLPITECSRKHPACTIARHLAAFASWIDTIQGDDKPCSSRVAGLVNRYESFNDTVKHSIDTRAVTFIGARNAPVTVLMYVSGACPLCKRVYKALYGEVTGGKLRHIAKLGVKVFSDRPIDIALLAAGKCNRMSDLLLSLAEVKERLSMELVIEKAGELGIGDSLFRTLLHDQALLHAARVSAQEAAGNGVTVTPTIFINNKRYHSYKDPEWIIDAAFYEYELLISRAAASRR
jgi:glutaredoxin